MYVTPTPVLQTTGFLLKDPTMHLEALLLSRVNPTFSAGRKIGGGEGNRTPVFRNFPRNHYRFSIVLYDELITIHQSASFKTVILNVLQS